MQPLTEMTTFVNCLLQVAPLYDLPLAVSLLHMPQYTNEEVRPRRGTWVFCVLNYDEKYTNIFFDASEGEEIVNWVKKLELRRPEFHQVEFWSELGSGICRVGRVFKAIRAQLKPGPKQRRGYGKFEAQSLKRCVGTCPKGGICQERRDPVTRRLVRCSCTE
jgi:hypothetical protein